MSDMIFNANILMSMRTKQPAELKSCPPHHDPTKQDVPGEPASGNKAPPKKKRGGWKKPRDKPKRPLSAYNLFFQQQRAMLLGANSSSSDSEQNESESQSSKKRRLHRKSHGKISFEDLARTIGQKWKALDKDDRAPFEAQASVLKQKYQSDLNEWKQNRSVATSQNGVNSSETQSIVVKNESSESYSDLSTSRTFDANGAHLQPHQAFAGSVHADTNYSTSTEAHQVGISSTISQAGYVEDFSSNIAESKNVSCLTEGR